jgi:hypothetical protein
VDAHRRELDLLQQAANNSPKRPIFAEHIAHRHRLWAFLLERQGRLPEPEASQREAVKVLEKSAIDYPESARARRRLLGDTL